MEYQILHPGPYLSRDDIEPYITKDKTKSIFSTVRGAVGVIRLYNKGRYLIAENGKRKMTIDFSRGEPVRILKANNRIFISTIKDKEPSLLLGS